MPWAKKAWNGGQRHYFDGPPSREPDKREPSRKRYGDTRDIRDVYFIERMPGAALCGATLFERATEVHVDGEIVRTFGGLSVKDKIDLMQRNICAYCLKKYLNERPELKAAMETMKGV